MTLWRSSNLADKLVHKLKIENEQHRVYADAAYVPKPWILIPSSGSNMSVEEAAQNSDRAESRVFVENYFAEVNKY